MSPSQAVPSDLELVLVGVDGSAESDRALSVVSAIAQTVGSRVVVVVAFDEAWSFERPAATIVDGAADVDQAEATQLANQACSRLEASGVQAEAVVYEGTFPQAVLAMVEEQHPDLVVVGVGRQSKVREFLLGSTAEKVVRTSPVSVLVVK
jgi:nucleotide-binding universal stress UspA family protein